MALYDDFPYTNFHSLNLDWIVKKLSELENGESTEESSSTATLAHNLSGNYPYTNFHSLNLDWIIRSMVELESDFETVENEWENLRATGLLTDEVKNAMLQCFQNVAWINDQGQTYYDALHDLFFPPVVVSTLTAVLDQGERVFHTGEDVNVIKDYLTVTAELSDGTLITVPSAQYILTGSLSQEGPNIIIVSYMNASTTITVNAATVSLVSISAVYTQSGNVYTTDTLDSLKSDLVVTATYDDSSTATVPSADYTLSGTLTEGTSTITVSYSGKTTTFNVTVYRFISNLNILFNDITLSDGYIGDDGSVVETAGNKYYDNKIKAIGMWILKSDGSIMYGNNLYYRIAEYDSNGTFISRKEVQVNDANIAPALAINSPSSIIMGFNEQSDVLSTADRFVGCNLLDSSICTIPNKSIDSSGNIIYGANTQISDYLPVNSGYIIAKNVNQYDASLVVFYDSSKQLISRNAVTSSVHTQGVSNMLVIAVPDNAEYVIFRSDMTPRSTQYISYVMR